MMVEMAGGASAKQREEERLQRQDQQELKFHQDRFAGVVDNDQMQMSREQTPGRLAGDGMTVAEAQLGSITGVNEERIQDLSNQTLTEELQGEEGSLDYYRSDNVLAEIAKADVDFMSDFDLAMREGDQGEDVMSRVVAFTGVDADSISQAQKLRTRAWAYQDISGSSQSDEQPV